MPSCHRPVFDFLALVSTACFITTPITTINTTECDQSVQVLVLVLVLLLVLVLVLVLVLML
jgi:hypothetical protein